jgi:hypothetical protein
MDKQNLWESWKLGKTFRRKHHEHLAQKVFCISFGTDRDFSFCGTDGGFDVCDNDTGGAAWEAASSSQASSAPASSSIN